MRKIGYCCFTDTSNIGDFALYKANQSLFNDYLIIDGKVDDPHCKINIFGGGTLYPYSLRYGNYPRRKLEFAIGQGILDPHPRNRFSIPTHLIMLARRMRYFGVRGNLSQKILKRHGIKSVVTGDTALFHQCNLVIPKDHSLIGVSFVGEEMQRIGNKSLVIKEVEKFCSEAIANGHRIALIPFCKSDKESIVSISKIAPEKFEIIDFWGETIKEDLPTFFKELKRCHFILGERLHTIVFAAFLGIPFLSIGYKHKCYDFVETLKSSSDIIISSEGIAKDSLYKKYINIINNDELVPIIGHNVNLLRNRLYDSAEEIRNILGH